MTTPATTPATDSSEQITHIGGLPLRLSFEPDAIREHFDADDGFEHVESMGDTDLAAVGETALCDDRLYRVFHEVLVSALTEHGHGPRPTTPDSSTGSAVNAAGSAEKKDPR